LACEALSPFFLKKNVALCTSGIHRLGSFLQTMPLENFSWFYFSFALAYVLFMRHFFYLDLGKLFEHRRFIVSSWRQQDTSFFFWVFLYFLLDALKGFRAIFLMMLKVLLLCLFVD